MTCIDWLVAARFGSLVLVGWSMGSAAVVEATATPRLNQGEIYKLKRPRTVV